MVSSIQTDYAMQKGAANVKAAQQSEATQNVEEIATTDETAENVSANKGIVLQHSTDRVEISPQGAAATENAQSTAGAVVASMQEQATQEATSDSTSSSSTSLTSLTEQEINDLVKQGSVTQSQANQEIARRTAKQQEASEAQTQTKAQASVSEEE